MASPSLEALVRSHKDVYPRIADPPPVLAKTYPSLPDTVELDQLTWAPRSSRQESIDIVDALEMSLPPTPREGEVDVRQSFFNPHMNRYRVISSCLLCFANGLNDGAPGALIPCLEKDYNIGYAVVSLIFVSNALGFLTAAVIADALQSRLGRARTLMLSALLMLVAYILILFRCPFPVFVVSCFLTGLGMSINLSHNNVFMANLQNSTFMLSCVHGGYGLGATIGPLVATTIATHGHWTKYYFLNTGVMAFNLFFVGWAFWDYERDAPTLSAAVRENVPTKKQALKQALKNRSTILGALFIFAYQGAEVSISGWVISFLITYRHGDPRRVGYVTSGFWAGITLGRFGLTHFSRAVGERRFAALLVAGAVIFEGIVWGWPNVVGDAVAVSLVGLLLGPVYPCAVQVFSRLLPRQIQMSSLSFISATGSPGGALAPFTTGILAQAVGTFVLHPVSIGLFVCMEGCWFLLPKVTKRSE